MAGKQDMQIQLALNVAFLLATTQAHACDKNNAALPTMELHISSSCLAYRCMPNAFTVPCRVASSQICHMHVRLRIRDLPWSLRDFFFVIRLRNFARRETSISTQAKQKPRRRRHQTSYWAVRTIRNIVSDQQAPPGGRDPKAEKPEKTKNTQDRQQHKHRHTHKHRHRHRRTDRQRQRQRQTRPHAPTTTADQQIVTEQSKLRNM